MIVQKNGELIIRAEQIIDEAYNRGKNDAKREISLSGEYERAYQRGLDDAWEAVFKFLNMSEKNKLKTFGTPFIGTFITCQSATEAIAKIKKYEQEHAPGCDNCKHKDDQFSVCSGCEDGSEYETETTEANCGECHRRYYCEASPDSCIYAKIAQAEPEKVDDEIRVGDEVIYQRKSHDPHNGEKGVVIGISSGNWREVRSLSNWSSVGVHENSLIKTGRHFSQIEEVLKEVLKQIQEPEKGTGQNDTDGVV